MFTRREISKDASKLFVDEAISHICDMCEEIQEYIILRSKGETVYKSKFIESCSNEDWGRAYEIADRINKDALQVRFYQNFVKKVKVIPEVRDAKLSRILK